MSAKLHWAYDLIDKPWCLDQRGPDGFSCWGLVVHCFDKQQGTLLPWVPVVNGSKHAALEAERAIRSVIKSEDWELVKPPLQGWDIITMRGPSGRRHVGLGVAANGGVYVLHCDGDVTPDGCVGRVKLEPLAEVRSIYKEVELWRKT